MYCVPRTSIPGDLTFGIGQVAKCTHKPTLQHNPPLKTLFHHQKDASKPKNNPYFNDK